MAKIKKGDLVQVVIAGQATSGGTGQACISRSSRDASA